MTKKEQKQFEKQLRNDVIKYLCNKHINLDNYKDINRALKEFNNKYYTEIKYKLHCDKNNMINIIYDKEININESN